jgi:pantothenate synthetase
LSQAWRAFHTGVRATSQISEIVAHQLESHGLASQYVSVVDADTLEPFANGVVPPRALLAVAAMCGSTRLIDNVVLGEDPDPLHGYT